MKTFVISDLHLGHANILRYSNRPYWTVEEMDSAIISEWNEVVEKGDVVYMLGDFCLGDMDIASKYFNQLNGNILVLNNRWHHDKRWLNYMNCALYDTKTRERVDAKNGMVLVVSPIQVIEKDVGESHPEVTVLCHYPFESWDRSHYGSTHLFGHIHSKEGYVKGSHRLDVGVDNLLHMFNSPAPIEIDYANYIMRSE